MKPCHFYMSLSASPTTAHIIKHLFITTLARWQKMTSAPVMCVFLGFQVNLFSSCNTFRPLWRLIRLTMRLVLCSLLSVVLYCAMWTLGGAVHQDCEYTHLGWWEITDTQPGRFYYKGDYSSHEVKDKSRHL